VRFRLAVASFVLLLSASPLFAAVTVTELVPHGAPRGARVVVAGSGFESAAVEISFASASGGRTAAPLLARSATLLEVAVPQDAVSGDVRVTAAGAAIGAFAFSVAPAPAFVKSATTVRDGLKQPAGPFVALPDGSVYVADSLHHQIKLVTPNGAVQLFAGTGNPGFIDGAAAGAQFNTPQAVVVDRARNVLYVADTANHVIRAIGPSGMVTTLAGSGRPEDHDATGVQAGFKQPSGLAIDADGNLYVADTGNEKIRRVTPAGVVTTVAGAGRPGLVNGFVNGPAGQALFNGPRGIAVAGGGVLYVADTGNHVIRKIENGVVSTLAGTGHPGSVDGVTGVAEFQQPAALALDESGELLIADSGNHRIRRIANGIVATVAGSGSPGLTDGTGLTAVQYKQPGGVASEGAVFIADTMNDALRVLYRAVSATDVHPRSGDPGGGEVVRIFGSGFVPGQTTVTFGAAPASLTYVSSTELLVTTPTGALGSATIAVTTPAGTATLRDAFQYVPPFVGIDVTPAQSTLAPDQTAQLSASGLLSGGGTADLTSRAAWSSSDPAIASVDASAVVHALTPGTVTITAAFGSLSGIATVTVRDPEALPPDPSTIAPPLRGDGTTSFGAATEFLYSGPTAIQKDVQPGAIDPGRVCVIRGRVITRDGQPLAGAHVSALHDPAAGYAVSRADGAFDFAVNGGGIIALDYRHDGYFPARRDVRTQWNAFNAVPTVVLVAPDPIVTTIAAGAPAAQVARGSRVEDKDGPRQATLIFPAGVAAMMTLANGQTQALTSLNVRATEYTVGPNGPKAMPAPLPPSSGYTYAVEFSVDEASGAVSVQFSKPVAVYVENFIGFPAGTTVPAGYFDRAQNAWIASENGRVIKVLDIADGAAVLDVTGKNLPATDAELAALGIDADELAKLASLYAAGRSLWRVPTSHFTPLDFNWPYAPPAGAQAPNTLTPPTNLQHADRACQVPFMSTIDCQNQTLGETIPIAGTGLALQYQSNRTAGFTASRTFTVKVTGAQIPQNLKRVELEISVAGRLFTATFNPAANLEYPFTWDGRDAYGRAVQGSQVAQIRIGNVYDAVYQEPAQQVRTFANYSGIVIAPTPARDQAVLWQEQEVTLESWPWPSGPVAGWTVNVHHSYDPALSMLYLGDGSRRRADSSGDALTTVSGSGCFYGGGGHTGDGGPAKGALLSTPWSMAAAPDGSLYILGAGDRSIRRIDPSGVITTIAGNNGSGYNGDEIPAAQAQLSLGQSHIVVKNGIIYFADRRNYRIRTITPDGIIHTVAGNGNFQFGGDGGEATRASLEPVGLDVAPDGTIYVTDWSRSAFSDEYRLRRITPDGQIDTIAGGPVGLAGDGGPAAAARFRRLEAVRIGPDGSLYLVDSGNNRVRRIGPDGIVRTFAGTTFGFSGDGGPATSARLNAPIDVGFGDDGSVYITDFSNYRIRRVTPDGIIRTVAGNGSRGCDEGLPALRNAINEPSAIAVNGRGTIYFVDSANHRVRTFLDHSLAVKTGNEDELLVVSEDGGEVYVFDLQGRHLRTVDARTKAVLLSFAYDSEGRLVSIRNVDGQVTTLRRDAGGAVEAIIAPGGQQSLVTTKDGWLDSITAPGNLVDRFQYDPQGLLRSHTNPRQFTTTFDYASGGRLQKDSDPAGGFLQLSIAETTTQRASILTTAMGRSRRFVSTFTNGESRQIIAPWGGTTAFGQPRDGRLTWSGPDGASTETQLSPGTRFGINAPDDKTSIQTPAGRKLEATTTTSAVLSDPSDPLSLVSETRSVLVNGKLYRAVYDAATRRITSSTPAGRTSSLTLDAKGRVALAETPGLASVVPSYDGSGRLAGIVAGSRSWTFTYNDRNELISATDPMSRKVTFHYDAAGRVDQETLPGNRTVGFSYDANGNVLSVAPPGRGAHQFSFTPVDLVQSSQAPLSAPVSYAYNKDRQLTSVTRADGSAVSLDYDFAGRLKTITTPHDAQYFTWDTATGNLSFLGTNDSYIAYTYDGPLVTSVSWRGGPVAGSISYNYDNDLRVQSENGVQYTYDADGLVTGAGDLTLRRDSRNGLLTGTTLGKLSDSYVYNEFGEVTAYSASYDGSPLLSFDYTRDDAGRIRTTGSLGYEYDSAGRLSKATNAGTPVAEYSYDANGNRLSHAFVGGSNTATYDAEDRLLQYGAATYTYTPDGELKTKTIAGAVTTYDYDAAGNLRSVVLPGTRIDYVIDAQNRRVGKKVDGTLTRGWLYADPLRVVAELDGSSQVVSQFVYGSRGNVPDTMIRNGVTYRILSDHLGSPRLVVNVADGTIAESRTYDEFGRVLSDSNPGFIPFGFAGGLYDADTGLTRFGARDYDAGTGRWTSKEPLGFAGGDTNFYAYAFSNPINLIDIDGLKVFPASFIGPLQPGDNRVTGQDIANAALAQNGSKAWTTPVAHGQYPAGSYKCNAFVADVAGGAGAPVPLVNGGKYPPTSAQWADPTFIIPGWVVVSSPQPGDIVATRHFGGLGDLVPGPLRGPLGIAGGHSGIVTGNRSSTSASPEAGVRTTMWPWRPDDTETPTFRRCGCVQ